MQVIMKQSELEVALKAYIAHVVNIEEGSVVSIDLKATRGDDGWQAVIEITAPGDEPAAKAAPVKVAVVAPKPVTPAPVATPKAAPTPVVRRAATTVAPVEVEVPEEAQEEEEAAAIPEEEEEAAPVDPPAEEAEPEAETPVPVKKRSSLFGQNMTRPKN